MQAIVHAADMQDRDGVMLMASLFGLYPFLLKLYADGGYQGPQFQAGLRRVIAQVKVEIVKRSDQAKGFAVLPRRWVVDVRFREDDSRVRNRTAARNLALLRTIALNIVGRDKTTKASVRAKRKRAAWNDSYMLKLLVG